MRKHDQRLKSVELFTDGSWKGKLNAGGWTSLLVCWPHWKLVTSSEQDTTISRMELTGVIHGLEELTEPCNVKVIADSKLVVNTINGWIYGWKKNNWTTKGGTPVANLDLVKRLYQLMQVHNVRAEWVKAHTFRKDYKSSANRICDYYAQKSADDHHKSTQQAHPMPK